MPDTINPERVRMIAEAAGIPISAEAPARIARAVSPTVMRFAAEKLAIPLEVEPSTFILVQRGEIER